MIIVKTRPRTSIGTRANEFNTARILKQEYNKLPSFQTDTNRKQTNKIEGLKIWKKCIKGNLSHQEPKVKILSCKYNKPTVDHNFLFIKPNKKNEAFDNFMKELIKRNPEAAIKFPSLNYINTKSNKNKKDQIMQTKKIEASKSGYLIGQEQFLSNKMNLTNIKPRSVWIFNNPIIREKIEANNTDVKKVFIRMPKELLQNPN